MPLLAGGRPALDLSGTTLVVGMGKSGLSAVRTLVQLGAEKIQVTDSRSDPPGLAALTDDYPAISCYTGEFRASLFAGADRIILSPGVSRHIPMIVEAAGRGIAVWGDVELFAQLAKAPVAAITGSNGKSTVTTLLGMMAQQAGLSVAVGGNLGTPPLELLERDDVQIYILELSSFQLETTYSLNARVASVLNISPDHMDRYAKMADYAGAKQRIFRGDGAMVLNADDPDVMAMAESHRRCIRFTLGEPDADGFGLFRRGGDDWLAYGDDCWLAAGKLKIPGYHNVANALAALAMGQVLQLPRPAMLAALLEFRGLPHRSELIADSNGVRWFNDSKGTNVGATIAAVRGLPGLIVLIAGGDGKGQDFVPLRTAFQDKVRTLIVLGRDGAKIADVVAEDNLPVYHVQTLAEAVATAAHLAKPGESVLLSPACASFDMFENYEERGHEFARSVRTICGVDRPC